MRKAVLAISFLSLSLGAVPALRAQYPNGGHKPTIATEVQRQLKRIEDLLPDLNPGQVTALTTLFTNDDTSNQGLFTSMRTAQQALRTAEKNNDSAGIQTASAQIGTLTGQITAARATFNASLAQILTADQLKRYREFGEGGRGGGWGGRGPGGHGGPGPGGPEGPGGPA